MKKTKQKKIPKRKRKAIAQRRYLQHTYLTKDSYPENIKYAYKTETQPHIGTSQKISRGQ